MALSIKMGGLMRCCIKAINEQHEAIRAKGERRIVCPFCTDVIDLIDDGTEDGIWCWNSEASARTVKEMHMPPPLPNPHVPSGPYGPGARS